MRAPEEIKADIETTETEQAEFLADFKVARDALMEKVKAATHAAGKAKRAHATVMRRLHSEYGAAMLALDAGPDVPLVGISEPSDG